MKQVTLKNLKLDAEIDGVSFSIDKDKTNWTFSTMVLVDKESQNFHQTDIGYKYQIVLYHKDKAEYFEAIIGDLNYYVKNLISINQEGIILKKCEKSEEILNKIFRGKLVQALAASLDSRR